MAKRMGLAFLLALGLTAVYFAAADLAGAQRLDESSWTGLILMSIGTPSERIVHVFLPGHPNEFVLLLIFLVSVAFYTVLFGTLFWTFSAWRGGVRKPRLKG